MNKSDRRLKTIESQQMKNKDKINKSSFQDKYIKKQSTKKKSLKQSGLKLINNSYGHQMHFNKKTYPNQKTNAKEKELKNQSKLLQEYKQMKKPSNSFNYSKSMLFSQDKVKDLHNSSIPLKGNSKLINDYQLIEKILKQKQFHNLKQKDLQNLKKYYQNDNIKKKHSKSVYNYTQFDDYKDMKKKIIKEYGPRRQRSSHNKSAFANNPHNISVSSATKRIPKQKDIFNNVFNNIDISKKIKNFKILSDCLKVYMREQQKINNKIQASQIIKLILAFNKSQISKMSKPLEKLISEMIELIYETISKQKEQQTKKNDKLKILKDLRVQFQTPKKGKSCKVIHSTSGKQKLAEFQTSQQMSPNPTDIAKTKKLSTQQYEMDRDQNSIREEEYHSSLSKDVIQMEKGLSELRSESKQLKKIITGSSHKKSIKTEMIESIDGSQKKDEITKLRQILSKQKQMLEKIKSEQKELKEQIGSDQSSLKYYPSFQQQ